VRWKEVPVSHTLIAGIDLLEAVRRYGLAGPTGTVTDAAALPFTLHERSEQPAAGPITFIELEGGAFWLTVGGDQQENFHYCAVPVRP
jgi:hypothetical protein